MVEKCAEFQEKHEALETHKCTEVEKLNEQTNDLRREIATIKDATMSGMSQQIATIEDNIVNIRLFLFHILISAIQEIDVRLGQCELTGGAPINIDKDHVSCLSIGFESDGADDAALGTPQHLKVEAKIAAPITHMPARSLIRWLPRDVLQRRSRTRRGNWPNELPKS